tara:strand:+ start:467 stop:823 length:357 start_codon:yes stop_codon:yes gene_type:complete
MNGTVILVLMAAGIGFFNDVNKPTEYELNLEDGTKTRIVLQKNNLYSCPLYCEANHYHKAVSCDSKCSKDHQDYHVHNFDFSNNSEKLSEKPIIFGSKTVIAMNKVKLDKPDIFNASK